jgi:hypothetical protein
MMKRVASLALLVLVSFLGASEVLGGAALIPAGKTGGPVLLASIVTDVTGGPGTSGKGLTSIKVRRGGVSTAAIFTSPYVASFQDECIQGVFTDLRASTESRFVGLMDGWVPAAPSPSVLDSLMAPFGVTPGGAAIAYIDTIACNSVSGGAGGGTRQILSFHATIRFQK